MPDMIFVHSSLWCIRAITAGVIELTRTCEMTWQLNFAVVKRRHFPLGQIGSKNWIFLCTWACLFFWNILSPQNDLHTLLQYMCVASSAARFWLCRWLCIPVYISVLYVKESIAIMQWFPDYVPWQTHRGAMRYPQSPILISTSGHGPLGQAEIMCSHEILPIAAAARCCGRRAPWP